MQTPSSTHKLQIQGMDCADCALTLEKGVSTLPGVASARVNFATAAMDITGEVDLALVTERIQKLGYGVAQPNNLPTPSGATPPRGGIFALARFFFNRRETTLATIAAFLVVVAFPLDWWGLSLAATALHLSIVVLAGSSIALRGVRSFLFTRKVTIDLLMTIATFGALLIGETGEAAMVIVLFAIGKAIEGFTADRARDSLRALLSLRPERATVLQPCMDCAEHLGRNGQQGRPYTGGACPFCGAHEVTISVDEIRLGDTVLIKPGEQISVDGKVVRGTSAVNQAPVTGESIPVMKNPGDGVFAGTINGEAALEVEVTRLAVDSTINKIVRLVEQAQSQRAPVERFVDRFAAWYTPAVVGFAAILAIVPPLFFDQPFFDTDGTRGWLYRALALLIVACPCALVISTPVTIVSAITGLARRGILIKGGQYLEVLARIKTFAFDKTGTLTLGKPVVLQARSLNCTPDTARCPACDDMLALAATVERRSTHPLAQAIVAEAEKRQLSHAYAPADRVESLAGKGIRGRLNGWEILVGSHTLLHENPVGCRNDDLHAQVEAAEAQGQTVMVVSRNDEVLGFIAVADIERPDSAAALRHLKTLDPGLRTVMLTGDNPTVAQNIASDLGIDDVRAGLLPEDKASAVRLLQAEYGPLAMIGDGINDAPALATATVGIAMGAAGTAQAMETADLVLMQDNLTHLPEVIRASRRAMSIIRQNIVFSLGIKVIFLVLTLFGWGTLWMAVFADMGASLLVTANGMRARLTISKPY